jgi:hypothetical protein
MGDSGNVGQWDRDAWIPAFIDLKGSYDPARIEKQSDREGPKDR